MLGVIFYTREHKMIVENHDGEVGNNQYSLLGRAGHDGSIDYPYQAEMWAQLLLDDNVTRRVYVYNRTNVCAVWSRDEQGKLYCVAQAPEWNGEWELSFLYENKSDIAVMKLDSDDYINATKMDAVKAWATEELRRPLIATAIALDCHVLVAAWEWNTDGPVLIAKGQPRPFINA